MSDKPDFDEVMDVAEERLKVALSAPPKEEIMRHLREIKKSHPLKEERVRGGLAPSGGWEMHDKIQSLESRISSLENQINKMQVEGCGFVKGEF